MSNTARMVTEEIPEPPQSCEQLRTTRLITLPPRRKSANGSLDIYLRQMIRVPLMSRKEEWDCGEQLATARVDILKAVAASQAGRQAMREIAADLASHKITARNLLQLPASANDEVEDIRLTGAILAFRRNPSATLLAAINLCADAKAKLIEDTKQIATDTNDLETLKAIRSAERRVNRARDRFVTANLRVVVSIAKRPQYRGRPIHDVIQDGNMGLIQAVEKFDHRRKLRFCTYASWWIRQSIDRGILNTGRTIRVPVHVREAAVTLRKFQHEFESMNGRPATAEELSAKAGMSAHRIQKAINILPDAVSLDVQAGTEDGCAIVELVSGNAPCAESLAMQTEMSKVVGQAVKKLAPREQTTIREYFGFDTDGKTLEEISHSFDVTREWIRQINVKAKESLRRSLKTLGPELLGVDR